MVRQAHHDGAVGGSWFDSLTTNGEKGFPVRFEREQGAVQDGGACQAPRLQRVGLVAARKAEQGLRDVLAQRNHLEQLTHLGGVEQFFHGA